MGVFDFLKTQKQSLPLPAAPPQPKTIDPARLNFRKNYMGAYIDNMNWGEMGIQSFLSQLSTKAPYPAIWDRGYSFLRKEAKKAYFTSPEAKASIKRLLDNTINSGLTLEASPLYSLLTKNKKEIDSEEKKLWTQKVEDLFKIWSKSNKVDIRELSNFNQIQKQAFLGLLREGEFFIILRYSLDKTLINPLQLQLIEPEQVYTPFDSKMKIDIKNRGNKVVSGIELDSKGKEIAYFVYDPHTKKSKRIPKFGPRSKRLFVIHGFLKEMPKQVRGLPFLTGIIQELKKISDYTIAEIRAAVINASIAGWVKPSEQRKSSQPLAGIQVRDELTSNTEEEVLEAPPKESLFMEPGVYIQNLGPGEEIQSYDTKRPNVGFDTFVKSVKKNLSASLSIPIEVLDLLFSNNYSASRASLILFWNVVEDWRFEIASMMLNPIYEMWMQNEIDLGRVVAPGFNTNSVSRAAWLNARWTGISKPSIDPFKESRAVKQRLLDCLSTREYESQQYNASSFEENVERLKTENADLVEANRGIADLKL